MDSRPQPAGVPAELKIRWGGDRYTRGRLNSPDHVSQPLYFEDLPLGGAWTTRRRTIAPADLATFAGTAGDMSPLLIDEPFARAGHFHGPVAPGTFLAAAAVGLGSLDVPLPATVGMVGMSWKFLKPVRPGDTIQTRWRLFRKRTVENPAWGLAFWHVEVLDQDGQPVAEGEVSRLVARRGQPAVPGAPPVEAPARRRRRRRGGSADRVSEVVESAPLPEPAPADAPPPSRRRRRRGGGGNGGRNGSPRPESAPESASPPAPEPPPVSTFANPAPPAGEKRSGLGGVFRRLRGS